MAPASKAQQKAVAKYMKNNYDEIKVRVPKGSKATIKAAADKQAGGSINGYVSQAINAQLKRDGFAPMQKQAEQEETPE
ncbi:ABC transporter ATP-binding protein [uncultured Ruminococcus sp.]|uniref:ABC transporter ATP-binding protein n=1 Tax=uncultured Ruminococcus sp. TaxID=165186 RepID=UPI0026093F72|nr:ABC transporter ATP-binding protein [uncultured Ruminococcus sp.]